MTNQTTKTNTGAQSFFFVMTGAMLYGFILTALIGHHAVVVGLKLTGWSTFFLGAVAMCGALMTGCTKDSESCLLTFIGYNVMIVPFGLLLGPALHQIRPEVLTHVLYLTAGITVVMGMTGVAFPKFYNGLGLPLFIVLFLLIVIRVMQCFIVSMATLTWVDYLSAGLFSLYIGYDLFKAYNDEWTWHNALWYATSLYLDILNLFLSLLNINSSKD